MSAVKTAPIFRNRSFYVPRFELYLGNRQERGSLLHDVMDVTYKDSVEAIDTFELTINNWDADKRRFKHHDSDRLNPGQPVRLHMGYLDDAGGLPLMIQGRITGMSPTFPASGQPTVKVSGQNVLSDFCKEQRSQAYKKATASKVAQLICKRLNVDFENRAKAAMPSEIEIPHLVQDNKFDIVFLLGLARAEGYEIVVEETKQAGKTKLVFVQPAALGRVTYELRYGATLIDFTPTLDVAKQVESVTVNGWDDAKGESISVEVNQQQLGSDAGLKKRMLPSAKSVAAGRKEVITRNPVRNVQEAKALARTTLERKSQQAVKGSGSTVGIPELRAGVHVYIWGLGRRFSGRYFVTGTTHSIGMSGYKTQFECSLEQLVDDPYEKDA